MVTSFTVSVVTVNGSAGLVYQKIFINEPEEARAAARRFEESHAEHFRIFDWVTTVKDY